MRLWFQQQAPLMDCSFLFRNRLHQLRVLRLLGLKFVLLLVLARRRLHHLLHRY